MRILAIHPGAYYVPDPVARAKGYPYAVRGIPYLNGLTVGYMASGGTSDEERWCIGNRGQVCSKDATPLDCLDDYIGGGSHYWWLWCPTCDTHYTYDTYAFKLKVWPDPDLERLNYQ